MKYQSGLTMIEILIAILILSVGLLGTAALQVRSVNDTSNANNRSVATYLAVSMADRIRANQNAMDAGEYNSMANAALNANCIGALGCTETQMANHDKQEWLNDIQQSLHADANGTLVRNGDIFTISVTWPERVKQADSQADASTATGTVSFTFEP